MKAAFLRREAISVWRVFRFLCWDFPGQVAPRRFGLSLVAAMLLAYLCISFRREATINPPPELHELQHATGVLKTWFFPPHGGRGRHWHQVDLEQGSERISYYSNTLSQQERHLIASSAGKPAEISWAPGRGLDRSGRIIYRLRIEGETVIRYEQGDVLHRQLGVQHVKSLAAWSGLLSAFLLVLQPALSIRELTKHRLPLFQIEALRAKLSAQFSRRTIFTLEQRGLLRLGKRGQFPEKCPDSLTLFADEMGLDHLPSFILCAASEDGRLRLESMLGERFSTYALRLQQLSTSEGLFDRNASMEIERRALSWPQQGETSSAAINLACFLEIMSATPPMYQGVLAAPLYCEIMASLRECLRGVRSLPAPLGDSLAKSMTGADFAQALRGRPASFT